MRGLPGRQPSGPQQVGGLWRSFHGAGRQLWSLGPALEDDKLFNYGFATDPALGIGSYTPPACRGDVAAPGKKQLGTGIDRFGNQLAAVNNVSARMLIFSSAATAEAHLADMAFQAKLRAAGIEWLGYNMEGDKTPPDEICSVRVGMDTAGNAVSRFARAAQAAGFRFIWGPIRGDLDRIGDAMAGGMCQAGLDGIAMQEQNTLSAGVTARIAAVNRTIGRYERLCGSDFYSSVQVMSRSCGADSCRAFAAGVMPQADSIAIWANGSEASRLNQLIKGLEDILK